MTSRQRLRGSCRSGAGEVQRHQRLGVQADDPAKRFWLLFGMLVPLVTGVVFQGIGLALGHRNPEPLLTLSSVDDIGLIFAFGLIGAVGTLLGWKRRCSSSYRCCSPPGGLSAVAVVRRTVEPSEAVLRLRPRTAQQ